MRTRRQGSQRAVQVLLVVLAAAAQLAPLRSAAADPRPDDHVVVVGGGPIGALSALAAARAAKASGREGAVVTVVESHGQVRTRDRFVRLRELGLANFAHFGVKPAQRELAGVPNKGSRASARYRSPSEGEAEAQIAINALEDAVYEEIRAWNAVAGNPRIRLVFGTRVKGAPVPVGDSMKVRYEGGETGSVRTRHVIVADGGRQVSHALADAGWVTLQDRGVESKVPVANSDGSLDEVQVRLKWASNPAINMGDAGEVVFAGDALTRLHFFGGDALSRGSTDAVAIEKLYRRLFASGGRKKGARNRALRAFRGGRLHAIEKAQQTTSRFFSEKVKGIDRTRRISRFSRVRDAVKRRLRRKRRPGKKRRFKR